MPALDGLRGLAISLVFMLHAFSPLDPVAPLDRAVWSITSVGWIGVELFFVISGFLITGILLDTRDRPARWRNFFARRVLRIFPLYYGVLIALFVIIPRIWSHPDVARVQADQGWYWGYAVNFLELLRHGTWQPLSTGHFWSLAIEEQFYLAWPLVVWACRPQTLARVAAGVMVAGLAGRLWLAVADPFQTSWAGYLFTPTHLDGLMVGALLAVALRSERGLEQWRAWAPRVLWWGSTAFVVFGVLRGGLRADDPVISVAGQPLLAGVFGALLVAALHPGGVARVFEHPALRWVGKYSYGLYVFHLPVIGALLWRDLVPLKGGVGSRLLGVLLIAAVAAVVSCAVAWLSYHAYEKHFLGLKRYFATRPRPGDQNERVSVAPK